MKKDERVCIVCGQLGTTKWTVSSGDKVAIVDVCVEHAAPMLQLVQLSEERAATSAKPWEKDNQLPTRIQREKDFAPLEWEPPKE